MKKLSVVLVVILCGILASVAYAATPQGKLTGGASFTIASEQIERVVINTTVQDGETVYVNKNNDYSGDCDGDTGDLNITFTDSHSVTVPVLCAHFSNGTAKTGNFSLYFVNPVTEHDVVLRILDRGQNVGGDKVEYSVASSPANAILGVNLGYDTCSQCIPQMTKVAGAIDGNYQESS